MDAYTLAQELKRLHPIGLSEMLAPVVAFMPQGYPRLWVHQFFQEMRMLLPNPDDISVKEFKDFLVAHRPELSKTYTNQTLDLFTHALSDLEEFIKDSEDDLLVQIKINNEYRREIEKRKQERIERARQKQELHATHGSDLIEWVTHQPTPHARRAEARKWFLWLSNPTDEIFDLLSPKRLEAFCLYTFGAPERRSYAKIARSMGVTPARVRAQIVKAQRQLETALRWVNRPPNSSVSQAGKEGHPGDMVSWPNY